MASKGGNLTQPADGDKSLVGFWQGWLWLSGSPCHTQRAVECARGTPANASQGSTALPAYLTQRRFIGQSAPQHDAGSVHDAAAVAPLGVPALTVGVSPRMTKA